MMLSRFLLSWMMPVAPGRGIGRITSGVAFREKTGRGIRLSSTSQVGEIPQLHAAPGHLMFYALFGDQRGYGGRRHKEVLP